MVSHYSLKDIFTTMIGFVTWPPFYCTHTLIINKGAWPSDKANHIVVKIYPLNYRGYPCIFFWN